MTITGRQIREARTLLGWTLPTLATRALPSFDEVVSTQDDIDIRRLGGLQLEAIRLALDAASIVFATRSND